MKISHIYKIAPGLNIEGGSPGIILKKNNAKKRWVNLVLVLDRPLIDNIIFDDIVKNNKFPLLENAIPEINEHQFLASYLMIIMYYATNGKKILQKNEDEILKITIHIHQDITCLPLIYLIMDHLVIMLENIYGVNTFELNEIEKKINIDCIQTIIDFRTDTGTFITTNHTYDETDILISLSQCAGLDPIFKPGALITPNIFIPYDIDSSKIITKNKYHSENSLLFDLVDILKSPHHRNAIKQVNEKYISSNPEKNNFRASKFIFDDFHLENIFQVNKLWNPQNPDEEINIIN